MSDLSPDAKNLFERAKRSGFDPSDAQVERVRHAVMQRVALAPGAPGGSAVGSIPKWAKVAAVCVGLGGLVATGAKLLPRSAPPVPAAPTETTAPVAPGAPLAEPPAPETETPAPGRAAPAPDKPRAEPGRAAPSAKSTAGEASSDTLAEEVRIVTAARVALRKRAYPEALASANDYASRFPKGVFLEEQLAIRILALCGLGRDKEAVRALESLERTVPNSRQLERVRSSCAGATRFTP
jgi:RNA polymerase sigma-70 factor (ECF subfamily)